ncbi:MAG: HAD hydrolase-like protein [Candidatus Niyogibacteria bacterium]|nr:HAD hydrolase-like protein [Candidatus Niyogibacteria bacterium]
MTRAVIFDLDDTLLDSGGIRKFLEIAVEFGLPLEGVEKTVRQYWGISGVEIVVMCWPEMDPHVFYARWAFCEQGKRTPLFAGVIEALRHFRERGILMAALSNRDSKSGHHQLDLNGITHFFHCVDGVGRSNYPKPHPRSMDSILGVLWDYGICDKKEILFVGDTVTDAIAARNAGVPFAGVLSGGTPPESFRRTGISDERILPSVACLPEFLSLSE